MNSQTDPSNDIKRPQEFFDDSSFKTLYGGVLVTWVSTNAIVHVWSSLDPKMLGFIVALVVAFVGFVVSEQRNLRKLVITPFNGLLIYLTIMGGTSFLPPPTAAGLDDPNTTVAEDTLQTERPGEAEPARRVSPFFTSWNPDRNLIEQTTKLRQENIQLETQAQKLQKTNKLYESKLDSTRQIIQKIQMPPDVQKNLLKSLEINQNINLMNNNFNPGL